MIISKPANGIGCAGLRLFYPAASPAGAYWFLLQDNQGDRQVAEKDASQCDSLFIDHQRTYQSDIVAGDDVLRLYLKRLLAQGDPHHPIDRVTPG
ncbi:MAG: hypothetical protein WCA27_14315 [Candidatus Sulfotelmatobacter sp.]